MRVSRYSKYKKGDSFEGFIIKQPLGRTDSGHYKAGFICHCGNVFIRTFSNMKREGGVTTKGCKDCVIRHTSSFKIKYECQDSRLYNIWYNMHNRCLNPKNKHYFLYGGRGITVCKEWLSANPEGFNNFYKDMGIPDKHLTLDRIDVDGGYSKINCRWADTKTQANNKRDNHYVMYEGKEYTIQLLSEGLNIKANTLLYRLRRGWTLEEAVLGTRKKVWERPYKDRINKEDFDRMLVLRYQEGLTISALAKEFGVDSGNLSRVFRDKQVIAYYDKEVVK